MDPRVKPEDDAGRIVVSGRDLSAHVPTSVYCPSTQSRHPTARYQTLSGSHHQR